MPVSAKGLGISLGFFYQVSNLKKTNTTATFVAVVDSGTRISFQFARCRYLSNFGILVVNSNEFRTSIENPTLCKNREYFHQSLAEV